MTNIAIENGPVEIVDLPINSMVDLSIVSGSTGSTDSDKPETDGETQTPHRSFRNRKGIH